MSISKEEYVAKIASASKKQLVIINFDIIIDYLNESKKYINTKDKMFDFNIRKARQFLLELKLNLVFQHELASYLMTLYEYIDKVIASYLFNENITQVDEAIKILSNIKTGFEQIKEEDTASIMQNTQSIYAGLTYGKDGKLNEFVDNDKNRGFQA